MGIQDVLITPIYLFLFSVIAYWLRPYFTDAKTRKYFMSALYVRFFGAVALGLIYQFYYGGGDTFNYWQFGSELVWQAFIENPLLGIKLIFGKNVFTPENYNYAQYIFNFPDSPGYMVIRFASFFDLFTIHTYSATALFFALLSFSGSWALYYTFYKIYPTMHRPLAWVILFFPSVVFWGSGIMKDTLTFAGVGWATYSFAEIFHWGKKRPLLFLQLFVSCWLVYSVKLYILMTFFVAASVWVYGIYIAKLNSPVAKAVVSPFLLLLIVGVGFFTLNELAKSDSRYALDQLAETARITAYDIRYHTGRYAGSGYSLGDLDGTWQSMIVLAPAAINVSLFRPYLWEVNNPLMLLAAIESLTVLVFTLFILLKARTNAILVIRRPEIMYCLAFALFFAFAVGISTYNFGTLMRYKIPLLPYYSVFLVVSGFIVRRRHSTQ